MVYSRNKQHLRNLQSQGAPLPPGSEAMDSSCCVYFGLWICGCGWVLQVRPGCILMGYGKSSWYESGGPDSHSRRNPWALWRSRQRLHRLSRVLVLPQLFSHAGTPGNRVGGVQFPAVNRGLPCWFEFVFFFYPLSGVRRTTLQYPCADRTTVCVVVLWTNFSFFYCPPFFASSLLAIYDGIKLASIWHCTVVTSNFQIAEFILNQIRLHVTVHSTKADSNIVPPPLFMLSHSDTGVFWNLLSWFLHTYAHVMKAKAACA